MNQNINNSDNSGNARRQIEIKDIIGQLIVITLIASAFLVTSSFIVKLVTNQTNKKEVEEVVKEVIREKKILITAPQCEMTESAYQVLKDSGQFIILVKNISSYAANNSFVGGLRESSVNISGDGEIACGYIYIRVSKNGEAFDDWDSVYINPHGFGGHLLRSKSIVKSDSNKYTEILLPLSAISYLPGAPYNPEAQNFRVANWTKLLNVNSEVDFYMGLSTENIGGLIEEVSIAYKCWNPHTGEETQSCQLSID